MKKITINGVQIKELKTNYNKDGSELTEIIRASDPIFNGFEFAQFNHVFLLKDNIKAWHVCVEQEEIWYVPVGNIYAILADIRKDSATYGEQMKIWLGQDYPAKIIRIPAGVVHGCKALSLVNHLYYLLSREWQPGAEVKIPHDDTDNWYFDFEKYETLFSQEHEKYASNSRS